MLRVTPKDVLIFPKGDKSEVAIELNCIHNSPIMYKIQTTSPEKFRVRPRCGVLENKQSVNVNIVLKPDYQLGESSKDKFLVLCMPAPMNMELTQSQIAAVWKVKPLNSPDVEQHRLCCVYKGDELAIAAEKEATSSGNIMELANHAKLLEKQLKFTQLLQYLTLFVLLIMSVAVVYLLRMEMDSGLFKSTSRGSTSSPVAHQPQETLGSRIKRNIPFRQKRMTN